MPWSQVHMDDEQWKDLPSPKLQTAFYIISIISGLGM